MAVDRRFERYWTYALLWHLTGEESWRRMLEVLSYGLPDAPDARAVEAARKLLDQLPPPSAVDGPAKGRE